MHSRATDRRSASKCQGKWSDQTFEQAFGLPEVLVAVCTSRLSCKSAGKTRTLMPVWDSSGESRLEATDGRTAPRCRGKIDNSDPRTPLRNRIVGERLQTLAGLPNSPEIRYCPRQIQVHPRNPGLAILHTSDAES